MENAFSVLEVFEVFFFLPLLPVIDFFIIKQNNWR